MKQVNRKELREMVTEREHVVYLDTSNITDMSRMLTNAWGFNQSLRNWDVSNVTNMVNMFDNADSFNRDISNWNVNNVTNMREMFYRAVSFNQNLSKWNVSKVTNMYGMFCYAEAFMRSDNFYKTIESWAEQRKMATVELSTIVLGEIK